MTDKQWEFFCTFKTSFKKLCEEKTSFNHDAILTELQQKIARNNAVPAYPVETNVVYNTELETISKDSRIKAILVADNPGKNEQLAQNKRYLIGQAGKLGDKFCREHPELGIDFRTNLLILNKSPLHTAKTALLKKLLSDYEKETRTKRLEDFFTESQVFMAESAYYLQQAFCCPLLIVGYGELGEKKIFKIYWKTLRRFYEKGSAEQLLCFQHFSMNRFTIDLKQNYDETRTLKENLQALGSKHRQRIFGF